MRREGPLSFATGCEDEGDDLTTPRPPGFLAGGKNLIYQWKSGCGGFVALGTGEAERLLQALWRRDPGRLESRSFPDSEGVGLGNLLPAWLLSQRSVIKWREYGL